MGEETTAGNLPDLQYLPRALAFGAPAAPWALAFLREVRLKRYSSNHSRSAPGHDPELATFDEAPDILFRRARVLRGLPDCGER